MFRSLIFSLCIIMRDMSSCSPLSPDTVPVVPADKGGEGAALASVTIGAHQAISTGAIPMSCHLSDIETDKSESHLPNLPPHISPGPLRQTMLPQVSRDLPYGQSWAPAWDPEPC